MIQENIDNLFHAGMFMGFLISSMYFFLRNDDAKKPKRLRLATAVLMAVMALQALLYFIITFTIDDVTLVEDLGLSISVNLIAAPFCVFVLKELVQWEKVTMGTILLHVGLPLLLSVVYIVMLFKHLDGRVYVLGAFSIWIVCYIIYYVQRTWRVVKIYDESVGDIYADVEGREINWLRRVFVILIVIALLFLMMKVIIGNDWTRRIYDPVCLFFWLTICNYIDQMRNNDQMSQELEEVVFEITEDEEKPLPVDGRVYTDKELRSFMEDLHSTLLNDRLYASEVLTRETVARIMNTNYKYLTRKLKLATGLKFSAYVTEVRMEEAARMLLTTNMTVEEIFYACGYQTKSTFYRAFAKTYGCTPVDYRKNPLSKEC